MEIDNKVYERVKQTMIFFIKSSIFLKVYISFYVSPKPAILQCIENFALEGTVSYFFSYRSSFFTK